MRPALIRRRPKNPYSHPEGIEMSLKHVHMLFIAAAVVVSLWFAVWSGGYYRQEKQDLYLILSLLSWMSVVGLIVYLKYFWQKYRSKLS